MTTFGNFNLGNNTPQDATDLMSGLYDSAPPLSTEGQEEAPEPQLPMTDDIAEENAEPDWTPVKGPKNPKPTMQQYFKSQNEAKSQYSENATDIYNAAISPESLMSSRFKDMHAKTPDEAANVGGMFGAGVGLHAKGIVGSLIGAGVGALVGRAMRHVQSGEHEAGNRRQKILDTMGLMKISSPKGVIKWGDGHEFQLTNNPSFRLKNMDPSTSGKEDRAGHELDPSHPMARRSLAVARPLAYFLSHAIQGWRNPKDPHDVAGLDHTTGMLVNALQHKATNINQVYARARETASKIGVTEAQMRTFFDGMKSKMDRRDAGNIKEGLDIIYGSKL